MGTSLKKIHKLLAEHAGEGERLIAYRAYLLGVNDCVNSEDLRELLLELHDVHAKFRDSEICHVRVPMFNNEKVDSKDKKGNYTEVYVRGMTLEQMADAVECALKDYHGFYLTGVEESDRCRLQLEICRVLDARRAAAVQGTS